MRVLVIGGGIGGFALATFLLEAGVMPVVVEKAPSFKALGHFIALKAEGYRVLDRLGVTDACRASAIPATTHLRFATATGQILREQDMTVFDEALRGYLMLRRSDLSEALHHRASGADLRFGVEVTALDEVDGAVRATFSDGRTESFDVAIGADGVRSRTRRLLFGDAGVVPFGGSYLALDIALEHGIPVGRMTCYLANGRFVGLLPTSPTRLSAIVYHGGAELRPLLRTPVDVRRFFAREYADFHEDVRQSFAAIGEQDFVFVDAITQIDLPRITKGRVALLGDAAACPTFLSGMGSAFAMLSAETLAKQLLAGDDVRAALDAYGAAAQAHAATLKANAAKMRKLILEPGPVVTVLRDAVLHFFPQSLLLAGTQRYYETPRAE